MAQHLPPSHFTPVNLRPVRPNAGPIPKPRLRPPILRRLVRLRSEVIHDDRNPRDKGRCDRRELGRHEEPVQAVRRLCADTVGHTEDDEHKDREELVQRPLGSIVFANGREDALDEDDAHDPQRGWDHRDDPRPRGQEPKDVAEDVLEIRLDSTCF